MKSQPKQLKKHLQKKLLDMARNGLLAQRPSRDEEFVKTVLFEAVKGADLGKVAELLREHPPLIGSRNEEGHTPRRALTERRHIITVGKSMKSRETIYHMLFERGSPPDIVTAIAVGDVAAVRAISDADPDVLRRSFAIPSWKGITPLAVACDYCRLDVVEALLAMDQSMVNAVGAEGMTAFDTLTRPWHPSARDEDELARRRVI